MNIKKTLRNLFRRGRKDRPEPPSTDDIKPTIVAPAHGWALERNVEEKEPTGTSVHTEERSLEKPGMSSQVEDSEFHHAVPPTLRGEGYVLGVDPRDGRPKGLLGEQRTHTYVLGKSGTGKTCFLLTQSLQDVEAGESVIILDPHADLARKFLSHIPKGRWKDVIYVNPLTAKKWGRVVGVNFLQHVPEAGRELAKRAFMSALKKIHPHSWGYRMESIMRYSLNLVYANMELPTLSDLLDAIGDRGGMREKKLLSNPNVDEETKKFWEEDYTDFREDFKISAQDKIYKLVSEKDLSPMIVTKKSDVDLFKAMNEGKIIVIDLPEGELSGDLTNYLGSLMLMRIYQAATARASVLEQKRTPVHLYIDEAHRFMPEIIQDNMRTLRKFRVFITGASQNLQEYGEVMKTEAQELADTIIAFKCGKETAQRISASFRSLERENIKAWEAIASLPYYVFQVSTPVGGITEVRIAETVDLKRGPHDWKKVVTASLEEHGKTIRKPRVELMIPPLRGVLPIQYLMLTLLAEERKKKKSTLPPDRDDSVSWRLGEKQLLEQMTKEYNFESSDIYRALNQIEKNWRYVGSALIAKDADNTKARVERKYYHLTQKGISKIYPRIRSKRIESPAHVTMLCQLIKRYRERNCYPLPITEKVKGIDLQKLDYYPDLLVYPPYRRRTGEYSPNSWDMHSKFAVEAEAFPTGSRKKDVEKGRTKGTGSHLDRTVKHFEIARDYLEAPVVFATRNERDAETVKNVLKEAGAIIQDVDPTEMEAGEAKVIVLDESLPASDIELQKQVKECTQYVKKKSSSKEKPEEEEVYSEERIPELTESGEIKLPESGKEVDLEKREKEKGKLDTGMTRFGTPTEELKKRDWESLAKKYRKLRTNNRPPEDLAKVLYELKELGCAFVVDRQKGKEYLQIRKYEKNKTKTKNVLSINGDVRKALEMTGIEI